MEYELMIILHFFINYYLFDTFIFIKRAPAVPEADTVRASSGNKKVSD